MAEFDLQGTVGLIFLGFLFYIWCKYRKPENSYESNCNRSTSTNTYYRAASLYHTSGMLHTNLGDCWKECHDLESQYPGESFSPETIRQ